mmetsp:Transcript_41751/g.42572  ORF Transcript_41751/g.42572 Transcript_41751/m.42572 type:complete len:136 (-) Transcript_41751:272-679(-)
MMMNVNNFDPIDEDSANVRSHFWLKKKLVVVATITATCGTITLLYGTVLNDSNRLVHQQGNLSRPTKASIPIISMEEENNRESIAIETKNEELVESGACVKCGDFCMADWLGCKCCYTRRGMYCESKNGGMSPYC